MALIGAGGKTTTMYRLAKELREEGKRFSSPVQRRSSNRRNLTSINYFLLRIFYALLEETAKLDPPLIIGAGYNVDEDGKLLGLPVRWFDEIEKSRGFDQVLVEADGAASRLFKIPSDIEPVVPASCQLTIWVMAIKILGKPLQSNWVHRPERVMALTATGPGATITQDLILKLVQHPEGCLKGIPSGSRKVALINQADSVEEIQSARGLAKALSWIGNPTCRRQ